MTFHGVKFTGDYFLLDGLQLHDGAPMWFTGIRAEGKSLSFKNADFRGSKVRFDGAVLEGGQTTFEGVQFDAVADQDATAIETGITRVGVRCTGQAVDWGPLPSLPASVP
jgi:hypothetical protein